LHLSDGGDVDRRGTAPLKRTSQANAKALTIATTSPIASDESPP